MLLRRLKAAVAAFRAAPKSTPPLVIPVTVDLADATRKVNELRDAIGEAIRLADVLRERIDRTNHARTHDAR